MTETSKQHDSSKLSLEDELDVLLPIYILGQSKGWEFLNPEQLKKLVDSGRLRWTDSGYYEVIDLKKTWETKRENASLMADMFMSTLVSAFEKALVEQLHYCSYEEWESNDQETKWAVDKTVFYMTFEIKLDELSNRMLAAFSGNAHADKLDFL